MLQRNKVDNPRGWKPVASSERLLFTLSVLNELKEPIGARRLAELFRGSGQAVAEATAGRLLRSLDEMGLTVLEGVYGRRLTARGRERLLQLQWEDQFAAGSARIAAAANVDGLSELLDILHTRRSVEGSAAFLAAERASDSELKHIAVAARSHVDGLHEPERVDKSANFHRLVVQASKNDMLKAIAELLIGVQNRDFLALLDDLLDEGGERCPCGELADRAQDHLSIAEALLRRDARGAEDLMRRHIEHMINAIGSRLDAERALADRPPL